MSHLGMKILYDVINQQPWALCERVCMPWVDMKALMEKEGVPLFSLETRTPLNRFDVVGFTLQYEMRATPIFWPCWAEFLAYGGANRRGPHCLCGRSLCL